MRVEAYDILAMAEELRTLVAKYREVADAVLVGIDVNAVIRDGAEFLYRRLAEEKALSKNRKISVHEYKVFMDHPATVRDSHGYLTFKGFPIGRFGGNTP